MSTPNVAAQTTTEGAADAPAAEAAPVVIENSEQDDIAKRVLRKIDRTIIPLLFVTYMFNFMDKIILSSAAVFGLREDNVGSPIKKMSELKANGLIESSRSAIQLGR